MSTENENSDGPEEKNGSRSLRSRLHLPDLSRNQKIVAGLTIAFGIAGTIALPRLQHIFFSRAAKQSAVTIVPANSNAPSAKAPNGPSDKRNGYTDNDKYSERLVSQGFPLVTRASAKTPTLLGHDLYPPYHEKSQTGLSITAADTNDTVYRNVFPRQVYANYDAIPPILVQSLFYVENRDLLEPHSPDWNPAMELKRLGKAARDHVLGEIGIHESHAGGSTALTQIEKFRHSPGGVTGSAGTKIDQMLSGSIEATIMENPAQDIATAYINSAPFASYPGFGEVVGFADALHMWFGEDFETVNRLLMQDQSKLSDAQLYEVAKVYREAFSLGLSVKKPSDYLQKNRQSLQDRVDFYLPILVEEHKITPRFAAAVKAVKVEYADPAHVSPASVSIDKATQSQRLELLRILKVPDGLYGMGRLDIAVKTTEDPGVNRALTRTMDDLADPAKADKLGLVGFQLLKPGAGKDVSYAVTLMERLPDGTAVMRAQTDNFKGPLNLNEGIRMQLGSTSKPPTAYLYLKAVKDMRDKYLQDPEKFRDLHVSANDAIAVWAKNYLLQPDTDKSLDGIVKAAMQRKYSGNPGERFYTAGGEHVFENFESKENSQEFTVEDALVHSVNLCFIRIMRDVENYIIDQKMQVNPDDLKDLSSPLRRQYLEEFAEFEGAQFLGRAWEQQNGRTPDEVASALAAKSHRKPANLAVIYRATHPDATPDELAAFIVKEKGGSEGQDFSKYDSYGPERYSLNDLIYLSGLKNPFDYWLAAYKAQHPQATRQDAIKAATQRDAANHSVTLEIYKWMLRPDASDSETGKHKEIGAGLIRRQNLNIQTILEQHAFKYVLKDWKEIGYPFADIVPSYASSIGVSGSTPKALAEFMGIIGSGGLRTAPIRFSEITLGEDTPYMKHHEAAKAAQVRVMEPEIAQALRSAMSGVVSDGTARRAYHSIKLDDGHVLNIYGKTGTGDNRESGDVKNRTATFMFDIDDRFYGTVLAYVDGPQAKDYKFTSALAAQLFKIIVNTPEVHDFLNRSYGVKPAPAVEANAAPKKHPPHLNPTPLMR